jgi:glycosyltransferase involved in cell wall biosynthesis
MLFMVSSCGKAVFWKKEHIRVFFSFAGARELNIYLLTRYTRAGASSRYRTFQYLDALERDNFVIRVSSLFDSQYLSQKYRFGKPKISKVLSTFVRRLTSVLTLPHGSLAYIEYELLPFLPPWLERFLKWRGRRIVVDYDDAIFHRYDQHPSKLVRAVLGPKVARVMQLADLVVVGNVYLAEYASRAGARNVRILPTVVDLERYPPMPERSDLSVFTIGWIGSPSTARYLQGIASALAEVCRSGSVKLRLIGSGPISLPGVPAEIIPWSEDTEVSEIRKFDVGIMPLPDEPWTRGKCGLKLIQYMAVGLPVVASAVGANTTIVEHGVNGFLANSLDEWEWVLRTLANDSALRQRMGSAGRARVERDYSLQVTAPLLSKWLTEVASGRGV